MNSTLLCIEIFTGNYGSISMCISNDYNVYSFGQSEYFTHGHKDEEILLPKKIQNLSNIKSISCGIQHTICIDYDGNCFSFGSNDKGQLGLGKTKDILNSTHIPQKIILPPISQISCGYYFTICLSNNGDLYSFGDNFDGQLATGNTEDCISPHHITYVDNIEFIECGASHFYCRMDTLDYYACGYNEFGQLGLCNNIEAYHTPMKTSNWPDNIISIKSGVDHTLILTSEGYVYTFGSNNNGQLGVDNKNIDCINVPKLIDIPSCIKRIECGYDHSLCIDINNNLWVFGSNFDGQLGVGDNENKYKPLQHPTLSNIIDISSGGNHTFVKTLDNEIYAFGYNQFAQMGIKTEKETIEIPIKISIGLEDIWCTNICNNRAKSAKKIV